MPYASNSDLPPAVRKLSDHQQTVFRKAFNAALKQYGDESKAYAVAWAAAKKADEQKAAPVGSALPHVWVRAHPYSNALDPDAHGEYFSKNTRFYDDLLGSVPASYYHNHAPDGSPVGEPLAVGKTVARTYLDDGRWDKIEFFDNIPADIRARLERAIEQKALRASPTVVPDFHKVARDGEITHWLTGSIAVLDADGYRQPASPKAIGIPTMKALYRQANLPFPAALEKSMGQTKVMDQARQLFAQLAQLFGAPPAEGVGDETKDAAPTGPVAAPSSPLVEDGGDARSMWADIFDDETELPAAETADSTNHAAISAALAQQEGNELEKQQEADIRLEYQNKLDKLEKANFDLARRADRAEIETWFDAQLRAGKVLPAEKAEILEAALQYLADDRAAPATMKSADDKPLTRLGAFQRSIEARAPRLALDGSMKAAGFDDPAGDKDKFTDTRRAELLAKSRLGEQVLADKRNGAH